MRTQEAELSTGPPFALPPILGGPPDYLSEHGREEWERVTQELGATGILQDVDRSMLAAYCCCYGLWREAQDIIRREGLLIREVVRSPRKGAKAFRLVRHPAVSIARDELNLMRSFGALFGLSPAHRRRLRR